MRSLLSRACATASLLALLSPLSLFAQSHDSANKLQPYVDSHALAGAVTLVADKNAILDLDTVGYADVAAGKPMQEDSIFWIASQTKPITAAAIMILVDRELVTLDSPIEEYLPEFEGRWVITEKEADRQLLKPLARSITVRDILSHMSGLPFRVAIEQPTLDRFPLADRVIAYTMIPNERDPGVGYQYSNVGINIAGGIIEVVSGRPYEDFLNEELFTPLGMKDTTFWPTEEQVARIAKTYSPSVEKNDLVEIEISQLKYPLTDRVERFPMPAGGLFSTARDITRFCQMVLNGGILDDRRYLTEESVHLMTSRQTPDTVEQSYGLGWQVSGEGYGHGGAYSTNMNIDPKTGLITILMVQHSGFPLNGHETLGVFRKTAKETFGPK